MIKNLKKYLVHKELTLRKSLKKLNIINGEILFVIDDFKAVIGTVTDGDIRRGLLRNISLNVPITEVMQKNFIYLNEDTSKDEAIKVLRHKNLRQIPVLDINKKLINLFTEENIDKTVYKDNLVLIMAGGRGERLQPATNNCPKPMLKIGKKPILEIIIEQFIKDGFRNFCISVNYLKDIIINYFGDGSKWGVSIHYLKEEKPLGTAGSIALFQKEPNDSFICVNGDVLTKVDYNKLLTFHKNNKSEITICLREHLTNIPYGVVKVKKNGNKVVNITEKPTYTYLINAGVYVIEPSVIKMIPQNEFFDMDNLIKKMIFNKQKVLSFVLNDYWLDIGHVEALEMARKEWLKK